MADVQSIIKDTLIDREANAVDFKMITFILAGKEYGVDIMSVKEIQKGSRFTYVPNAPTFVRGVYNLRGDIIPVIDLRKFFGLPEYEEREELEDILILRQQDSVIGVIVDSIQKVVGINRTEIQPAHPLFADVVGLDYIYGVVEKDESLYVILDTKVILGGNKEEEEEEEQASEEKAGPTSPQQEPAVSVAAAPASVPSMPVSAAPVAEMAAVNASSTAVSAEPVVPTPAPTQAVSASVVSKPVLQAAEAPSVSAPAAAPVFQAVPEEIEPAAVIQQEEKVAEEEIVSASAQEQPGSVAMDDRPTELDTDNIANVQDSALDDGLEGPSDAFYEGLFEYANFCPSELNQEWLIKHYDQWSTDHLDIGKPDAEEAKEFLEGFYSSHTAELWDEEMVDEFCELVAQDEQKITHIWNVGSGQGFSAYSIAGGLFLRDKKCKVYATDSDLLAITGAPGLTFTEADIPEGFKRAMVEGPKGWQFSNEVKNTIIFEYHDIANEHSFPKLDVIVVRDILSFVDEDVFMKFFDRIFKQAHPGTLLIIGDNERIMDNSIWSPVESRCFSAYRKIG